MKDSLQSPQTICNPAGSTVAVNNPPGLGHAPAIPTQVVRLKRTGDDLYAQNAKRQATGSVNVANPKREVVESVNISSCRQRDPAYAALLLERERLQTQRLEFETEEKELASKVEELQSELLQVQREYQRLQAEANSLAIVKEEAT
ncbi:unnamed protein product [Rhodiola kirilowii]